MDPPARVSRPRLASSLIVAHSSQTTFSSTTTSSRVNCTTPGFPLLSAAARPQSLSLLVSVYQLVYTHSFTLLSPMIHHESQSRPRWCVSVCSLNPRRFPSIDAPLRLMFYNLCHSASLSAVLSLNFQKKTGTTISNSAVGLQQTHLYNPHEDVPFLPLHIHPLEHTSVQRAAGTASTTSPSPPARAPRDGAQIPAVSTTRTGMKTSLRFPPSSKASPW